MPHKSFISLINADFQSYRYLWSGSFILSFRLMKMTHPCWEMLLWMPEQWNKNGREWSWWKKRKEKLGEKLWSRSPQGEWEILTGSCRGGTHHSKNLKKKQCALLPEKAGVRKWNHVSWGKDLARNMQYTWTSLQ